MNASKRNRSWLATSLVGALALAYVFIVFLPRQRSIAAMRFKLREKEDAIALDEQMRPVAEAKERQLKAIREYTAKWRTQTPGDEDVANLFGAITDQAQRVGVTTVRFEPQPAESMSLLQRVPITLGTEGTFHELFRFIKALELLPATVWVEDLQFSRTTEDSEILSCELNLAIFTVPKEISD